jgi:tetratricopeptide (TPR) repeat protein
MMVAIAATLGLGAAAQDSARAKSAYDRAVALEAQGNHAAALALLWEASGAAPREPDIQNRLGEALDRLGALDAAIDAYRRALAERPSFRQASNNLILALVKVGKGPEAIRLAQQLVTDAPTDPDRYFTLGLAQSEQDFEGAIRTFRKALELAPNHTLARYNLALVLRRADRLDEALEELRRSIASDPRAEAYYTMGVIQWHQGDLDRSVQALRAAVNMEPRYADAYYALGSVLKARGDPAESVAALRRAIAIQPDRPTAHYALAQALQLSGDIAGARGELAESERLRRKAEIEHEAVVATSVGIQKMTVSEWNDALGQFTRAVTISPDYAPAHYQMGLALRQLGRLDESRKSFDRARKLNPNLVPPVTLEK